MTLWLNHTMYERIVKHRSIYYAVGYVDYSKLMPSEIDFVPRQELMKDWEGDYTEICGLRGSPFWAIR